MEQTDKKSAFLASKGGLVGGVRGDDNDDNHDYDAKQIGSIGITWGRTNQQQPPVRASVLRTHKLLEMNTGRRQRRKKAPSSSKIMSSTIYNDFPDIFLRCSVVFVCRFAPSPPFTSISRRTAG